MTKFSLKSLNWFEYFLIVGIISINTLYCWITNDWDALAIIATCTGVINVVLVAKGSILNYLFGVINVFLCSIIYFKSATYGLAALNALYFLPMQFIGWYNWRHNLVEEESDIVQSRKMNTKQMIFTLLVTICSVVIGSLILKSIGGNLPIIDAISTIIQIIAMFLMIKAFSEQWILWVVTNVINVVLFIILVIEGQEHSILMLVMHLFYLINSINGWIQWRKSSCNVVTKQQ